MPHTVCDILPYVDPRESCNTEVNLSETHVQYVNYISISFKIGNDFIIRDRIEFVFFHQKIIFQKNQGSG